MSKRERQPVYVVSADAVIKAVAAAEAVYKRTGEWAWREPSEVRAALLAQKEKTPGHYDLSRLCHALSRMHTSKMIGGANNALELVRRELVAGRIRL